MTSSIPISIKYGNTTYHMHLPNQSDLSKTEQFDLIAKYIHISSDRLKLIYKGKRYTKENWHDLNLISNMTLLSIGEQNEDETDMNTKDIECLMQQMKVDRNTAMVVCEIREGRDLFSDAFSIHQHIPEFQIDANTHEQLTERMNNVKQLLILVAYVDERPIWLAGVLPEHRGAKIFVQLMNRVEQWAWEKTYSSLTIKTRNSFKSMLRFLISHDFKLIDIDKRQTIDSHRLLLEKQIIRSKES